MAGRLHPSRDPGRRCLKLEAWPPRDRAAWLAACRAGGVLDPHGRAADWRPASRRKVTSGYGRFLGWLERRGELDPSGSAVDLLTVERAHAFVEELRQLVTPVAVLCRVTELRQFTAAVYPQAPWGFLRRLEAFVRRHARPARDKRTRLRSAAELVALGEALMAEGLSTELDAWQRPTHFRDGLMIALLALRPLRLGNFAGLRLGLQLRRAGEGWWLCIPPEATKNRRPIEQPFPERLVPWLERYLATSARRFLPAKAAGGRPRRRALGLEPRLAADQAERALHGHAPYQGGARRRHQPASVPRLCRDHDGDRRPEACPGDRTGPRSCQLRHHRAALHPGPRRRRRTPLSAGLARPPPAFEEAAAIDERGARDRGDARPWARHSARRARASSTWRMLQSS